MTNLEPLPSVILALTEQRSLSAVLETIIQVVARQPGVALARLWLNESAAECPVCTATGSGPGLLHLRASAGASAAGADWSRINGAFHTIDLSQSNLKIAHIALTGRPIRVDDLANDREWVRFPEWAEAERLVSFAGHPLVFRGDTLGVLAVFRREPADDECFHWLRTMANAAAVAIANARAFEENESLRKRLELERDYLMEEVEATGSFGEILGRSPALDRVLRQVAMVAPTSANVLVLGESGTGKELVARAIHQRSERANKPLVKVNCGSIPRDLFESEFFGHVRGAFTSAVRDRIGRFQLADGGTLFLDEVGEIPVELQSKLLRVLQEGQFERVGEETTRRVNVRVIAATNRDLQQQIDRGQFRLDLYYRLSVFPLELPPLRERKEDIPELLAHFVRLACARSHLPQPAVPQRELARAERYHWPGNVRELQNLVERGVILAHGGKLRLDLPEDGGRATDPPRPLRKTFEPPDEEGRIIPEKQWRERERANLVAALRKANFKISGKGGAAELLELHPATLTSRMKVLGIRRERQS
ncbi:MAG: sigma 54-interacting transcriptional regulator [Bryobacteraceae bacterium]